MFIPTEVKENVFSIIACLRTNCFDTAKVVLDDTIYNLNMDKENYTLKTPEISEDIQQTINILQAAKDELDSVLDERSEYFNVVPVIDILRVAIG